MTLIGVTGGFSTGKTTVCRFFGELGASLIDADKIVHQLYRKDKKIKRSILKNFGEKVLTRGRIDRAKLGKIVFNKKGSLIKLCNIVHPKVIKKIKEKARRSKRGTYVIDAPLLIEANLHKFVDCVVVVRVAPKVQVARCRKKGFSKKDLALRGSSQMSLQGKLKIADFVVDNNHSKQNTKKEVMKIWQKLKRG